MLRRYSFLPLVLSLVAIFAIWSKSLEKGGEASGNPWGPRRAHASESRAEPSDPHRLQALLALESLVRAQNRYRTQNQHFTRMISRTGFSVPAEVAEIYEFRVTDAGADRLSVTAISEHEGRVLDWITMDQDMRVRANFDWSRVRRMELQGPAPQDASMRTPSSQSPDSSLLIEPVETTQ